jgi:hypothetical protein
VRAAPLTVTPPLPHWPMTRRAADALVVVADELLPAQRMPFGREPPVVSRSRGATVVGASQETGNGFSRLDRGRGQG